MTIPVDSTHWRPIDRALFAVAVALNAAVPWIAPHFPTQDGANHRAVAYILAHYADASAPFHDYFRRGSPFTPSALYDETIALLAPSVGWVAADKLLASVAVVLLPLGVLSFVRAAVPRRTKSVFLILPLVGGFSFAMGFTAFLLALGVGFATLAISFAALRAPAAPLLSRAAIAAFGLWLCAYLHPMAAAMFCAALFVLHAGALIPEIARLDPVFRPPERASGTKHSAKAARAISGCDLSRDRPSRALGLKRKSLLALFAIPSPAASYAVASLLLAPSSTNAARATWWPSALSVITGAVEYHVAYSRLELATRGLAIGVLAVGAARAAFRFGIRSTRGQTAAARPEKAGDGAESATLRAALFFALAYAALPKTLLDWSYFSARFWIVATFLLPAAAEFPARFTRWLPAVGLALTVSTLGVEWPAIERASGRVEEILAATSAIPRGAKLIFMDFEDRASGLVDKPRPLAHAWAELVPIRAVVAPYVFAAGRPRLGGEVFRQLAFRDGVLDRTGSLPWPGAESGAKIVEACEPGAGSGCARALGDRRSLLDAARPRYDFVLLVFPTTRVREELTAGLTLSKHAGAAWLYSIRPSAGPGPSNELLR